MNLDEISQQPTKYDRKWPTGFVTQYKYLTVRSFQLAKSRTIDPTKLVEQVVICFLFGLIWFQLPRTEETVRDRMGAVSVLNTISVKVSFRACHIVWLSVM